MTPTSSPVGLYSLLHPFLVFICKDEQRELKSTFGKTELARNMHMKDDYTQGYSLSLNDANRWWITSERLNASWLNKLAAIMELSKGKSDGSSKLIFCNMRREGESVARSMDSRFINTNEPSFRQGWLVYHLDGMRVWCHNKSSDFICEMNNSENRETQLINMWNSLQFIYYQAISRGGLPFHAALIELRRHGILIALG